MSEQYYLAHDALNGWLSSLAKRMRVMVPAREGSAVVYKDFDPETPMVLDSQTAASPKSVIFPQNEYLMEYRLSRDTDEEGHRAIELKVDLPDQETLVFGSNPCGARGIATLDPVFLEGQVVDPYFKARRDKSYIVSIACTSPNNTCFCNWVEGAPDDTKGSDLSLVPVEGGYLVRVVTDKGASLVGDLPGAEDAQAKEAEDTMAEVKAAMGEGPGLEGCHEYFEQCFDDLDLWKRLTEACIHCGACTYNCPTCYCFNITDEASGLAGERLRSWDSCMFAHYTREASGHNPRPTKEYRYRNRILHKFLYYPTLYGGTKGCTGCGRCIHHCPAGMDIREVVTEIKASIMEKNGD